MYFGDELGGTLPLKQISLTTWIYPDKLEVTL